ncbi:DUF4407 domain-containing protein [Wielerella bovis]|uniref:DUF4407 domain-containing protein n=1 Tax=Wielerella bovis TaxID=2917790 RepID=UPI002018CB31|nr:DUF4407 domain-containing protein [Wielerella bovis]MCG7656177.1 DUF4407 domain-containing protein [Wielerella bovis]MCG7658402.1 DUF4407 domain-containing protein [Wielerella bovis]
MKTHLFSTTFFLLAGLFSPLVYAQTTYICVINDKPYYTTQKVGRQCYISALNSTAHTPLPLATQTSNTIIDAPIIQTVDINNTAEHIVQTTSVPQTINDEISRIWNTTEYGSFDDTIIIPPTSKPITDTTQQPTKSKTIVRNKFKGKTRIQTAKVVAIPAKLPVLTRRQVLQKEIDREKLALRTAQTRLTAAQKSGNTATIARLNTLINDRQQNLSALEAEMRK